MVRLGNIICNGTTITDSSNTAVITDCGVTASDTLTITQSVNTGASSNDDSSIFYVEVGGLLLVDRGIGNGDTKLVKKRLTTPR